MSAIISFITVNREPLLWLLASLVLLAVEAATTQMVCIWFSLGAFVTVFAAMLGWSFSMQLTVFFIVSALALVLTRRFVKDVLKVKSVPTNADSVIGLCGSVTEEINNLAQTGKVFVNGLTWTGRSRTNEVIPVGATVVVDGIEGVKVIVEPVAQPENHPFSSGNSF